MNVVLTPATIAKLELGPDDIIIVRSTVALEAGKADLIGQTVRAAVGDDHKVLVLAPNLSLEVIAK